MEELRRQHEGATAKDHVGRIAKEVLRKCDPQQYLLSHATIVASVDTYEPKGARTGKVMERGVQLDIRYPNYRVKPACQEIINNNGDAWERSLLLSTYRTFIGAPNYLEHIQIPELSKGFIVDAIARDLGDTCYIDILVATDRKHEMLVGDIMAGNITAMSMGCISLFTICSRCGNVASDDSQLCPHVLYDGKNTKFLDEEGIQHRLCELIGHVSIPNSNQFIEASWVRNPAFAGAERRNILNPDSVRAATLFDAMGRAIEVASQPLPEGPRRAASIRTAQEGDEEDPADEPLPEGDEGGDDPFSDAPLPEGGEGGEGGDEPSPDAAPAEGGSDPMDELLNKAQELLVESLVKSLGDKLAPKPEDVATATPGMSEANLNETLIGAADFGGRLQATFPNHPRLIRWASSVRDVIARGQASRLSHRDLIVFSWITDTVRASACPPEFYKVAMSIGPQNRYPSRRSYMTACRIGLGKELGPREIEFFMRTGSSERLAGDLVNFRTLMSPGSKEASKS